MIMIYRISLLLFISLLFVGCNNQNKKQMSDHTYTNALIDETSPYLLQHAHNPVDWHPWNEKTLALAKKENKLLLISVGYAACHWCHVMERESFEDTAVANIMNQNFINSFTAVIRFIYIKYSYKRLILRIINVDNTVRGAQPN